MFFKFEYIGDQVLLNVPDTACWEIRYRLFDDEGNEDHGLYLTVGEKEYQLRDLDLWCSGRPELPYMQVALLYETMVEHICDRVSTDPNCRMIDIDALEMELIHGAFEQLWLEKGYITPDENGHW